MTTYANTYLPTLKSCAGLVKAQTLAYNLCECATLGLV